MGYLFRCFEAQNRYKSTSTYQLVKTFSICNKHELSCMMLITRAEQIGLTWPGPTRRARSILQHWQPKTQQNHKYCASIEKSTANAWLFLHILIHDAL